MKNTKKLFAIVVVLALVLTSVFALVACNEDPCKNGHDFQDGKCTRCDTPDPDYVAPGPGPEEPTPLTKPVLTLSGNVVSWSPVAHADNYSVSVNGGTATTQTATNYTVNETAPGNYEVSVVANSNSSKYTSSEAAKITYTVEQPTGLYVTKQADYVVVDYDNGWSINWTDVDFSDLITATFANESVDYADLEIVAAGDSSGEGALTLTVSYGEEDEEVVFDVYFGIASDEEFRAFEDLTAWYIITDEITFTSWMGMKSGDFTGRLNGNHMAINDILLSNDGGNIALFENVGEGGVVENLYIASGEAYGEGLVAVIALNNYGSIINNFVNLTKGCGGPTYIAGITYDTKPGSVTQGNVFIGEVWGYDARTLGGVVGYGESGWVGDNLFVIPQEYSKTFDHATDVIGALDGSTSVNNATVDALKLVFAADNSQFWSSDNESEKYTNNFTDEVLELIQEYLRQLAE